jgi:hypothetical protein
MVREVRAKFGTDQTLVHESDAFLRKRFLELVADDPGEYGRKVVHNLLTVPSDGVYSGEFIQEKECQPRCWERYGIVGNQFAPSVIEHVATSGELGTGERARYGASLLSAVEARAVPVLAILVLPFYLFAALRRREIPHVLVGAVFAFQVALNTFAFTMSAYTANVYVPMLVVLAWAAERLLARRPWRRRRGSRSLSGAR